MTFFLLLLCLVDAGLGLLGLQVTDRFRVDNCCVTAVKVLLNFVFLCTAIGIAHTGWWFTRQYHRGHLFLQSNTK